MTPKTPLTTLKKIGDSPTNGLEKNTMNEVNGENNGDLSKRELFKEKLSAINIQSVCYILCVISTYLYCVIF